ncbi:MAG: signal peptidase I [Myxococcales bacterium]|nr:signal peptidase I [Myxococcales bacterium]
MARKNKQRGKADARPGDAAAAPRRSRAEAESTILQEVEAEAPLARRAWDQIWPMAVAVLVALAIRALVIESYYVPSESMLPTLLIGDHVFVNKYAYGARIPFTEVQLPSVRDPERGEIVVFALGRTASGRICPLDHCPDASPEGFVKRLVGVPGDRIEYRNGVLYLNGEAVPTRSDDAEFTGDHGYVYRVVQEDLHGCRHPVLDLPGHEGLSQVPFTVPEGRYFMLGDNRDNSNDSRAWGTVRREELKGPVILNYWSWNNRESWLAMLNPLTWVRLIWSEMRWERIGMDYDCRTD